jgi:hypothetical protein
VPVVAGGRSKREELLTGGAAIAVLAVALWLFFGRLPGPARTTVDLGRPVTTDAGRITVFSLEPVPAGSKAAPPPESGHTLMAIRFRACRANQDGEVVDLSRFGVRTREGVAPVAGSSTRETPDRCAVGEVFSQVPVGAVPTDVQYDANPFGDWRLP